MKKAGIITLYYGNDNYGGIAQAFALRKYIDSLGIDAELISYQRIRTEEIRKNRQKNEIKTKGFIAFLREHTNGALKVRCNRVLDWIAEIIIHPAQLKRIKEGIKDRKAAFQRSRDFLPHSPVYTDDTIHECTDRYDYFITGSDQVWKPGVLRGPFVFDFVEPGRAVFSYASSITSAQLDEEYGQYMKEQLSKYKWISVRETSARDYLEKQLNRTVDVDVDPTLLMDENDWVSLLPDRVVNEPYLFAYLLGESRDQRRWIETIAKERKLKIVTLPHLTGRIRRCDIHFGETQLYDIDLMKFLRLIKDAELVCTDSFHAVVFSNIFESNFMVFERQVSAERFSMMSRIETLLDHFEEADRFVSSEEMAAKCSIHQIDFATAKKRIKPLIDESRRKLALQFEE